MNSNASPEILLAIDILRAFIMSDVKHSERGNASSPALNRYDSTRRDFLKTSAIATLSATLGQAAGNFARAADVPSANGQEPELKPWRPLLNLRQPAIKWIEGLPLANGISSAMVWGVPSKLILSLNHVDFWRDNLGKKIGDYSSYVREAQRLMLEGKVREANELYVQKLSMVVMPRQTHSYPSLSGYTNSFQPLGNVIIEVDDQVEFTDYRRTLGLQDGIATINYTRSGAKINQEYFIPAKHDALIVRMTSEEPISARIFFERPDQAPIPEEYKWSATAEDTTISVQGVFSEGVKSAVLATARILAGSGRIVAEAPEGSLRLANVSDILLVVTMDAGKGQHSPVEVCRKKMAVVSAVRYEDVCAEHCEEHSQVFNRVELVLADHRGNPPDDTDRLVSSAIAGNYDNALAEQVFQMGRYLMMSCNRAGLRPANLQGIWNDQVDPAWDSDWHFDMNIEMSHWLVNPTNLDECNHALFRQMRRFIDPGKMNAKNISGCRGILFYGLGGNDETVWSPEGGMWTGAAPWIAQHFWTHYEFTLDQEFLAEQAYPFLRQVGLFYKDWLVKNREGKYVTGFSHSPENVPPNGSVNNVHCTMDTAMVREVMRHLLEGGRILDADQHLWPVWRDLHDNVLPYETTDSGALKEWPGSLEDQPNHRHFSHLYPLYPGDEFTRESSPQLYDAARKALLLRETGKHAFVSWSYPYVACLYARLGEGDKALRYLHELARINTLSNLLAWYPVEYRLFQIEACLGATAAIGEMLLQSHRGCIRLLPALPSQWANGHFKGLKARGAFLVDVVWKQGKLTQACIKSLKGEPCRVLNCRPWNTLKLTSQGEIVAHEPGSESEPISFATKAGRSYTLIFG